MSVKSPYKPRNAHTESPEKPQRIFGSEASRAAVQALKANPAKLDECQNQLDGYNPSSAKGFQNLLRYVDRVMKIDAAELSKQLGYSQKEIDKWMEPEGHPPNSLIRSRIRDYALRRLRKG